MSYSVSNNKEKIDEIISNHKEEQTKNFENSKFYNLYLEEINNSEKKYSEEEMNKEEVNNSENINIYEFLNNDKIESIETKEIYVSKRLKNYKFKIKKFKTKEFYKFIDNISKEEGLAYSSIKMLMAGLVEPEFNLLIPEIKNAKTNKTESGEYIDIEEYLLEVLRPNEIETIAREIMNFNEMIPIKNKDLEKVKN